MCLRAYVVKSNDELVNNLGVNLPGRMASTSPITYQVTPLTISHRCDV
jgi:hypothetical protein